MDPSATFSPLLLISALAFLVPIVVSRIPGVRVPVVVGEIAAGILVGKSGLQLVPPSPALDFLALFGLTYLMFLAGLEIDFSLLAIRDRSALRHPLREPALLGPLTYPGSLLLAFLVSLLLLATGLVRNPFLMALVLSTTSVGIVVPTLKERGLTATQLGQTILAAAVAADFATMLLLSVFASTVRQGLSAQVLLVLVLFVAFFAVSRFGLAVRTHRAVRRILDELGHATAQIQVRGTFLLVLAFIALAQSLGAEVILGAFLAGVSITLLAGHGSQGLRQKLDAIGYGFLIPIFFITAGVGFDLPALLASGRSLVLVPGLVLSAFAVKLLPALAFRAQYGWRQTLAAGSLLSARLSLIVAAAAVGVRLGLISDALNAAIILVAILTSILAPILFSLLFSAASAASLTATVALSARDLAPVPLREPDPSLS